MKSRISKKLHDAKGLQVIRKDQILFRCDACMEFAREINRCKACAKCGACCKCGGEGV